MFGEKEKEILYIGSDHAGYESKEGVKKFLAEKGYAVTDLGCFSTDPCDYPDIAREVCEKILEREGARGILICGTGTGMSIMANRFKGIRAANCGNEAMAEMARKHNNANVLTMGARVTPVDEMNKIAIKFLETPFEADQERHVRRVEKLDSM